MDGQHFVSGSFGFGAAHEKYAARLKLHWLFAGAPGLPM